MEGVRQQLHGLHVPDHDDGHACLQTNSPIWLKFIGYLKPLESEITLHLRMSSTFVGLEQCLTFSCVLDIQYTYGVYCILSLVYMCSYTSS